MYYNKSNKRVKANYPFAPSSRRYFNVKIIELYGPKKSIQGLVRNRHPTILIYSDFLGQ